jgi:saccharopine dehydrogenase-like NADP-dependent oxidoreductase
MENNSKLSLMKIITIGCGNIGSIAAEDLAKSQNTLEIVIADKDETKAKNIAKKIGIQNVSWTHLDATNHDKLTHALKNYDLAMGFLPGKLGFYLAEACIEAKTSLIDVSYMPENPLKLNSKAAKANVTIIPDCGLAPGISNILIGNAVKKLESVQAIHIMVGGLPEKPVPPLDYIITWSPENLIDEYVREAKIVKDGKKVEVEALSGVEEIEFPGFGKLEAFYTDGLRTLPDTIENVEEMWEKTLRYPGHAEKIKLLRSLGFFEEKETIVDGVNVSPRRVTVKLLGHKLSKPKIKDIVALKAEVCGFKDGKRICQVYHLLDYYDEKQGITAMARTTAYTASAIAQLMLKGIIKEKGVVPPEKIGMNDELFKRFLEILEKHGIKIREEKITC